MDPRPDASGTSPAMAAFLRDLDRVASSEATVLLVGESGSGKSRAARRLHAAGPRSGGPRVEVQLAALAPSLVEAELFGHEAGAFTGAAGPRTGRVRAASGGTLVLDGVELLPLEQQVKLLRVLQERVVEPLGGDPEPVDVRVVATSSLDLAREAREGRFREDLYYRLAVVSLRVPPLRSRPEDLPDLTRELLAEAAARAGVPARELGPDTLERLAAHPWPGNVRELENALERALVLGGGPGPLRPEEFDFLDEALEGGAERLAREALAHGLDVDTLARAMMDAALDEQRGNVSAAARQVGLSRRAFEYRRRRARPGTDPE